MLKIKNFINSESYFTAEIEKLMNIETAQIQAMQHITMHKQLLAGNSENPVEAILNILD